ncbi:helix-turn-helix transcriptional regulator [Nitrosopumilus sp. Nsub]|uniref:helix-turn-helix transcriptional regulator n=1 Tax=Nitrosopumilus sp. Nsub TaxID=1776294 RepID=UPI00082F7B74|nr:helix-turn-helix transcriptional regulator [Nitrosopumilus sp. Nsub]
MLDLIQTKKITEEERKQVILESLADRYCKLILKNTLEKPKSAMNISQEEEIPLSTVYRKLQKLYDGKLLAISGSINRDGKRYFLYMSKIREINIHCDLMDTKIDCVLNNTKQEDIN